MIINPPSIIEKLPALYSAKKVVPREVNLIGLRDPRFQMDDVFNDRFGIWVPKRDLLMFTTATTDPGKKATLDKEGGAAHLADGFHSMIWAVDYHAANLPDFKHLAFCSRREMGCKPTRIWRDRNRDTIRDVRDDEEIGYFGINGHRASVQRDVQGIGLYSYGCQVVRNAADFEKIRLIAAEVGGASYLYDYMIFTRDELWVEGA